jgi:hypothetical protein
MFGRALKAAALIVLTLALVACASHTVRVKCDGPLRPINVPALKQAGASSDPGPVAGEK